jgi:hypothetical protein
MATIEEGLRSQLRNIEATYGRSIEAWLEIIRASGLARHGEIVTMLKRDHGLPHGAAHRLALVSLAPPEVAGSDAPPAEALFAGRHAHLRPLHDRVMGLVQGFGPDVAVAPKKGYLSLRARTQFAMLKPAANHLDIGLVLPGEAPTSRFESAATFNALFTHRVRVVSETDVDDELTDWLRRAYERAR